MHPARAWERFSSRLDTLLCMHIACVGISRACLRSGYPVMRSSNSPEPIDSRAFNRPRQTHAAAAATLKSRTEDTTCHGKLSSSRTCRQVWCVCTPVLRLLAVCPPQTNTPNDTDNAGILMWKYGFCLALVHWYTLIHPFLAHLVWCWWWCIAARFVCLRLRCG